MPTDDKQAQLLGLLRTDPDAGLRAAMQLYAPLVKGICLRILPHRPADVEECVADTFVALWRSAGSFSAQTPLRAWLAATARNRALNCWRALSREHTLPLSEELAETLGEAAEFDRATTQAEDVAGDWMAALPQPDRDIFLRRYYLLQSTKEIAAALGMQPSAVNTRLSRGRARLRLLLQEKGVCRHA